MLDELTCLILTYNEEPNIRRTLQQLTWVKRIVVIDSQSTDGTLDILRSFPQVEVYQRKFDRNTNQWNFGLEQTTSEWVLALDADFVLSDELITQIQAVPADTQSDSFLVRFRHFIGGRPLRGTLIPPQQVLYRRAKARYFDDGHTQRIRVSGSCGELSGYIWHDDRKPFLRWLNDQNRYMEAEVHKLHATPVHELDFMDRIRRLKIPAPFVMLLYCLIVKRGILDGWAGWYYAMQRMFVEVMLAMKLIDCQWRQVATPAPVASRPEATTPSSTS